MEEDKIVRKSTIEVAVGLNANNLPIDMQWSASDTGSEKQRASAMFLSFWNPADKETMKIDLWAKEMSVEEMKQFFHQTLLTMADTFEKATGEKKITDDMRDFCYHFAEKMEILPEE